MSFKFEVGDKVKVKDQGGILHDFHSPGSIVTFSYIEYDANGIEGRTSFYEDKDGLLWGFSEDWYDLAEEAKSIDDMLVEKYGISIDKGMLRSANNCFNIHSLLLLSEKEDLEEGCILLLWAVRNWDWLEKMYGDKK